jgi:hypothetical protein
MNPRKGRNGRTIEEECRLVYRNYTPPPTEEQQRLFRARRIAALKKQIAAIERQPYQPHSEEQEERELDQTVWIILKSLHGELDKEDDPHAKLLQSKKVYTRWSLVSWAHDEKKLSWREAYARASRVLCDLDYCGGSPRTMKAAYQLVQRIRRVPRARQSWSGTRNTPLRMS